MPTTIQDIEDHVRGRTGVPVVAQDAGDIPAPDTEAIAIYNSIALNLLLRPKAILYLALLARNALINTGTDELAAIDTLTQTLLDLGNITLDIVEVQDLIEARNALVELQSLDKIDPNTPAYIKYVNSINDFLARQLAKNVKTPGKTDLKRPAAEAAKALSPDYLSVTTSHDDLINRLNALAVGVDNFKASTLQTVLGQIAVGRAKIDVDDIIATVQADSSGSQSKEIAIRLLSSKAAVKASANFASIDDLLLDDSHPVGYTDVVATTDPAPVIITSTKSVPIVHHPSWNITYNDGTSSVTASFPQTDFDYGGFGWIASTAVTYPVTIPSGTFFYVMNGPLPAFSNPPTILVPPYTFGAVKVPITSGSRTIAQIITDINSIGGGNFAAREFIQAGTNRIVIYSLTQTEITLSSSFSSFLYNAPPGTPSTLTVENLSCHTLCGFDQEITGTVNTKAQNLIDAFNLIFSTVASCALNPDTSKLVFTSVKTTPGISVTMSADDISSSQPFGFVSITSGATSQIVNLSGSINGVATNPIDPSQIIDPGDQVTINGAVNTVDSVTTSNFKLTAAIPTITGTSVTANSAVKVAHDALNALLGPFMQTWSKGKYAANLITLSRVIAPLNGNVSLAVINNALAVLTDLRTNISSLVSLLQNSNTVLPSNAGTREKEVVTGIINTLQERKYDRALDFFMRCEVLDMFQMDSDSSSYAGNVQSALSDVAQTDVQFPDKTKKNTKNIPVP